MPDDRPPLRPTIPDAVLHLHNEQPLRADLFDLPSPSDVGLLCTNLRMMNGKRPVFVDDVASIFFFPYQQVRFVEIHPAAGSLVPLEEDAAEEPAPGDADQEGELEIDEDFLRRIRDL